MDLALYDPAGGYYRAAGGTARPDRRLPDRPRGPPDLRPGGRPAARRGLAIGSARRARFVVREHGAGTGTLAVAILDGLRRDGSGARARRSRTTRSRSSRAASRRSRRDWRTRARRTSWPDPRPIAGPIVGAVLANEVLDALPVHRVAAPAETHSSSSPSASTGTAAGRGRDRAVDAGPRGAPRVGGHRARRRPDARRSASPSSAGSATPPPASREGSSCSSTTAHPATELYDPVRRRDGTLRAYIRHRVHDDPFRHVGRQDLTAHVDVTAVERAATAAGLEHLGDDDPGRVPGRGSASTSCCARSSRTLRHRRGLPRRSARRSCGCSIRRAMGGFRVMAFGRGWPTGPPLAAFAYRLPERPRAPDGHARPERAPTGLGRVPIAGQPRRRAGSAAVGHDLTGSGARTCTRARRAPLPDAPPRPALAALAPRAGSLPGPRDPPAAFTHGVPLLECRWAPVRRSWVRLPARPGSSSQRRGTPGVVARREFG